MSDPLLFLDSDHLAASFLVANPRPGLSERANPFGSPVLFHTADIDLATGKAPGHARGATTALRKPCCH